MSTIPALDKNPSKILLFNHARAQYTPTSVIVNGLFESNNYDGIQANKDWVIMNEYERTAKGMTTWRYITAGLGLFSAYSCVRFTSLSKSGKFWAPVGLVFSAYAQFSIAGCHKFYLEQAVGKKVPETPKE